MKTKIPTLDAVELISGLTLEVRVTRFTEYKIRKKLALFIIRIAIWIANKVAPFGVEKVWKNSD